MNWKGMSAKAYRSLKDKSPEIFSVGAIAGVITTATLSVKCYKNATSTMKRHGKVSSETDNTQSTTRLEYIKLTWKDYAPAVASSALTIFAIVASNRLARRKQVALTLAYTAAQKALSEFVEQTDTQFGPNKVEKIRDAIAADHIKHNDAHSSVVLQDQESLCFDGWSGRYFAAKLETVKKAQNDLNYLLISGYDTFITLNQFYEMIGLDYVSQGDALGWDLDSRIELIFSAQLTDDGRPAIHISFKDAPHPYK